jgi:hypothetical protein
MTDNDQQDAPVFDEGDEAQLSQAGLDPLEYRRIWTEHARLTGEGIVPEAELLKEAAALRKAGHHDQAMELAIRAQSSRVVEAPAQITYHDLPPRLQAEYLRRWLAK